MNLKIFGITYGDKTTEYNAFPNKAIEKLHRFEYNPMIDIIENHISDLEGSDLIGIFSWKFKQKTSLSKVSLYQLMSDKVRYGIDVYNLSPNLGNNIGGFGCFMDWSSHEYGHGEELRNLIKLCCEHTGLTYENNPPVVIYANQFIATKDIYEEYMFNVVKPSLQLLEGELWERANVPAGYSAGVGSVSLKKHTGLDFYNYVPFVLERMFMQFVHSRNLTTIPLI